MADQATAMAAACVACSQPLLGAGQPAGRSATGWSVKSGSIPVGTDFIGGAAALPVRPAEPSQAVLGSDFAGGTVPLAAEVEHREPAEE
jgi:hypothetical protein